MRKAHVTIKLKGGFYCLFVQIWCFSPLLSVKLNFHHLSEVVFSELYHIEVALHHSLDQYCEAY